MRRSFSNHFDMIAIVISLAVINIVERFVVPVPGFMPVVLMLLVLGGVFATRMILAGKPHSAAKPCNLQDERDLHAAFDFVTDGIAVLDQNLQAIYFNKEFRRLFRVPDGFLETRPDFTEIVAHGRRSGAYQLDDNVFEEFCAQRLAFVRATNPQPVTLRLADHMTVRCTCSILPDGGRLLTYANITDLVNDAERLEELANIDGLTGLVNRRRFFELAERDWALAIRYDRAVAVLMIDIDHFKAVNDTYGHDVGDVAISHVAAICKDSKRATDVVARVGGEEFALLLPDTDLAGALIVAERIRARVAANAVPDQIVPVLLTVSIGAAQRHSGTTDFMALMKRGDQLLYVAKRGGRNRVACDEASPTGPARLTQAA